MIFFSYHDFKLDFSVDAGQYDPNKYLTRVSSALEGVSAKTIFSEKSVYRNFSDFLKFYFVTWCLHFCEILDSYIWTISIWATVVKTMRTTEISAFFELLAIIKIVLKKKIKSNGRRNIFERLFQKIAEILAETFFQKFDSEN